MRIYGILSTVICFAFLNSAYHNPESTEDIPTESLRKVYSQSPEKWPKPTVDDWANFEELAQLPSSPFNTIKLQDQIILGRLLFHDPRLSGSNQISCASCHSSDLNWTDGRRVSLGHDHQTTNRNTPTIENSWAQKTFFWDGRAADMKAQAIESISNPTEMNQDPQLIPGKLERISGYVPYFQKAFGDSNINLDRVLEAIVIFQKSISSRKSAFDNFLIGEYQALTDQQIHGLHLFRTKARCINCHQGAFFTDNSFHNLGLTNYKNPRFEDLGLYNFTKNPADVGKFKTPTLRNALRTGPWMHNGIFNDVQALIQNYNVGMPSVIPNAVQAKDPLWPKSDEKLKVLHLTAVEQQAIIAFLNGLTSIPRRMDQPQLPR